MTLSAGSAPVFFRRVFYQSFVCLVLVGDVLAFVAVYTADPAMYRLNEIFINTIRVPAPHLRGRDTSTGYGSRTSGRSGSVTVHFLEVGVTLDAFTAGCCSFRRKDRTSQTEGESQAQKSDYGEGNTCPSPCSHCSSLI